MTTMATKKTEVVRFRCSPETKKELYIFKIEKGFKSLEDAVKYLLKYYKGEVPRTVSVG